MADVFVSHARFTPVRIDATEVPVIGPDLFGLPATEARTELLRPLRRPDRPRAAAGRCTGPRRSCQCPRRSPMRESSFEHPHELAGQVLPPRPKPEPGHNLSRVGKSSRKTAHATVQTVQAERSEVAFLTHLLRRHQERWRMPCTGCIHSGRREVRPRGCPLTACWRSTHAAKPGSIQRC